MRTPPGNPVSSPIDYDSLVLRDRIHSSIYTNAEIFEQELERIFYRGWVYVGHESEIPNAGDFQARLIGRQPVLYVRGEDGDVRVLMNRCTHRAAIVCPYESGNAKRFTCAYHGWVFRNTGALFGVPHQERYDESFHKQDFGLRPAPRTASYRGLTFASLSADGPSLDDHLGPLAKAEIDIAFDLSPQGQIDVSCGIHKYGYAGNWKLQVENATDGYHLGYLHRSYINIAAERSGRNATQAYSGESSFRVKSLGNGHVCWDQSSPTSASIILGASDGLTGPQREYTDAMVAAHGPDRTRQLLTRGGPHVLIFPNLVFIQSHIRMIRPVSVSQTEVFLYPYRLVGAPAAINTQRLGMHQSFYGPAGGGASDDLEVFERISAGIQATLDQWVLIRRGLGQEQIEPDGAVSGQITDELNNRAILQYWKRIMSNHSTATAAAVELAA